MHSVTSIFLNVTAIIGLLIGSTALSLSQNKSVSVKEDQDFEKIKAFERGGQYKISRNLLADKIGSLKILEKWLTLERAYFEAIKESPNINELKAMVRFPCGTIQGLQKIVVDPKLKKLLEQTIESRLFFMKILRDRGMETEDIQTAGLDALLEELFQPHPIR